MATLHRLAGLILFVILCSCGIKGRPLPPENNVVNINQIPNSSEPTPVPVATPAKSGKDIKKTNKKK